jgi:hypothetical protein
MQSKGGKSYRDKYKAFWVSWVERLLSLPREDGGRRIIAHDILRTVADQLVALSSMAVVNIRDAVTEAALSVAQALLHACAGLRAKLETARRQIAAEESSRSKAAAQQNPKYQACLKQRDSAAKVRNRALIMSEVSNGVDFCVCWSDWYAVVTLHTR